MAESQEAEIRLLDRIGYDQLQVGNWDPQAALRSRSVTSQQDYEAVLVGDFYFFGGQLYLKCRYPAIADKGVYPGDTSTSAIRLHSKSEEAKIHTGQWVVDKYDVPWQWNKDVASGSSPETAIEVLGLSEYDHIPIGTWIKDTSGVIVKKGTPVPRVVTQDDYSAVPMGSSYVFLDHFCLKRSTAFPGSGAENPIRLYSKEDEAKIFPGQWVVDSRNVPVQWPGSEASPSPKTVVGAVPPASSFENDIGGVAFTAGMLLAIFGIVFVTLRAEEWVNKKFRPATSSPPHWDPPPPPRQKPPPWQERVDGEVRVTSIQRAYEILGIPPGHITLQEARIAYRKRIAEYHPDKVAHLGQELRELADRKALEINLAIQYIEHNCR